MFLPVSLFDLLYLDKMEFPHLRFPALTTNRGWMHRPTGAVARAVAMRLRVELL